MVVPPSVKSRPHGRRSGTTRARPPRRCAHAAGGSAPRLPGPLHAETAWSSLPLLSLDRTVGDLAQLGLDPLVDALTQPVVALHGCLDLFTRKRHGRPSLC